MYRFLLSFWRWLALRLIEDLVCLHFCKFRQAGSDLIYTHVHILRRNPKGVAGLGHDDHTATTDDGHTTISKDGDWHARGGDCVIQAEDEESMALREVGYLATAYFHAATGDECPEGFARVRCKCRTREGEPDSTWVCYTLDHPTFQRWYDEQRWTNRTGRYEQTQITVASVLRGAVGPIDCGSSVVVRQVEIDTVQDCTGLDGPGDGDNRLILAARAKLQNAAAQIVCKENCAKRVTETFVGWKCAPDSVGAFQVAEAIVQWRIECERP